MGICHSVGVQFLQASESHYVQARFPSRANNAGQQQPLPVPPLLGPVAGGFVVYDAAASALVLYARHARADARVNGRYLGPTIRVWKDDVV